MEVVNFKVEELGPRSRLRKGSLKRNRRKNQGAHTGEERTREEEEERGKGVKQDGEDEGQLISF